MTAYYADQSGLLVDLFVWTDTVLCSEIVLCCIVSFTIRCWSMTVAHMDV